MTDYRDLLGDHAIDLPGQEQDTSSEDGEDGEGDVSLITGKVRTSKTASHLHSEGQLTVINDKTIRSVCRRRNLSVRLLFSLVHENGGGAFLAGRAWSGLEQKLGETEVREAVQGRRGIAAGYEGEGET